MDTNKTITIYDGATGETTVRDMTPEEVLADEARVADSQPLPSPE
jgi:hypothetical protein